MSDSARVTKSKRILDFGKPDVTVSCSLTNPYISKSTTMPTDALLATQLIDSQARKSSPLPFTSFTHVPSNQLSPSYSLSSYSSPSQPIPSQCHVPCSHHLSRSHLTPSPSYSHVTPPSRSHCAILTHSPGRGASPHPPPQALSLSVRSSSRYPNSHISCSTSCYDSDVATSLKCYAVSQNMQQNLLSTLPPRAHMSRDEQLQHMNLSGQSFQQHSNLPVFSEGWPQYDARLFRQAANQAEILNRPPTGDAHSVADSQILDKKRIGPGEICKSRAHDRRPSNIQSAQDIETSVGDPCKTYRTKGKQRGCTANHLLNEKMPVKDKLKTSLNSEYPTLTSTNRGANIIVSAKCDAPNKFSTHPVDTLTAEISARPISRLEAALKGDIEPLISLQMKSSPKRHETATSACEPCRNSVCDAKMKPLYVEIDDDATKSVLCQSKLNLLHMTEVTKPNALEAASTNKDAAQFHSTHCSIQMRSINGLERSAKVHDISDDNSVRNLCGEEVGLPSNFKNPFNMRVKNLQNFMTKNGRPASKSQCLAFEKAKAGCVTTAAMSLDLLRENLQAFINKDIENVLKSYLKTYFEPGIENIRLNNGRDSVTASHIDELCLSMLDEAKKMYGREQVADAKFHKNQESYVMRDQKLSAFNIRKRRFSSTSDAIKLKHGKNKRRRGRTTRTAAKSVEFTAPAASPNSAGGRATTCFGAKQPAGIVLSQDTEFLTGSQANKALGHGNMRGRLYTKHPELFRYLTNQEDKVWLNDHHIISSTYGRTYLLLASQVAELCESTEYRGTCNLGGLNNSFLVESWMLDKMQAQMQQNCGAISPSMVDSPCSEGEGVGLMTEIPFSSIQVHTDLSDKQGEAAMNNGTLGNSSASP